MITPFKKDKREEREDDLHRKYGFNDIRANEGLEKTERYILHKLKSIGVDNMKNVKAKKYFKDKIEFHRQWDRGILNNWRNYYRVPEEIIQE